MWDLIKLEYRKCKISTEISIFIIGNLILYAAAILANAQGFSFNLNKLVMRDTNTFGIYNLILVIGVGAVIFGGFAFFEWFNEEVEENSMKITYLFPQGRKKIIIAKALAALIFTAGVAVGTYIIQGILVLLTKDIIGSKYKVFQLPNFIDNISAFIIALIISLLLVLVIILIAIVIKSATFNTFSIIIIGIGSNGLNSYFIEILNQHSILMRIGVLLGIGLMLTLVFLKILKVENRKDI